MSADEAAKSRRRIPVAAILPLVVFVGLVAVFKVRQADESRVRAAGVHAQATIVDLEDTGGQSRKAATLRIHATLASDAGAGRRVAFERVVGMHEIDRFARGRQITVAVDPKDPDRVVLVE